MQEYRKNSHRTISPFRFLTELFLLLFHLMEISINGRVVPSAEERQRMFNQLITPNINKIRRYVAHMTFPGEDADDNLQEVLIALFRNVHLYDPSRATLAAWSCVVTRSVLSRLRLPRRMGRCVPTESLDVLMDEALDCECPTPRGMEVLTALSQAPQALPPAPPLTVSREVYPETYDALMRLTAVQRRVLLLVAEGWTPTEVAAELRMSPAAVRQQLHRARSAMQSACAAHENLHTPRGSYVTLG